MDKYSSVDILEINSIGTKKSKKRKFNDFAIGHSNLAYGN
jgi:hypothetical protein